ncbi:MAG: hypothetical protein RLZZ618_3048 [Pseudomonadota bacterium]
MQPLARPYWHPEINPSPDSITEVSEYGGDSDLSVICTQLAGTHTPAQQKRIVSEWCAFFSQPQPVRRLWLHSRTPQSLFQSICSQANLQALYIKWSAIDDASPIEGLKSLTHLYIGSSSKITSIDSLASLQTLVDLSLENLQGVDDYSAVGQLANLTRLAIQGDGVASMKKSKISTLQPIARLVNLERLRLIWVNVLDGSYACLSSLKSLRHLDLPSSRPSEEIQLLLKALTQLETGNVLPAGKSHQEAPPR